jgi:hypothetical protein
MKFITRGSRAWQLLTVAVIAVPWLLRDELAVRLDEHTSAAEQVQTALFNESQRAQQAAEQRANRESLRHIEILVMQLAKEASKSETEASKSDLFAESIRREAEELLTSVQTFDDHLADTTIHPKPAAEADKAQHKEIDQWLGIDSVGRCGLTKEDLQALSAKVRKTAEAMLDADAHPEQAPEAPDWSLATTALGVAYEALHASAAQAQDRHASWAHMARLAAWLFTALGALMIGDWSRLLRGPDADTDPASDRPRA